MFSREIVLHVMMTADNKRFPWGLRNSVVIEMIKIDRQGGRRGSLRIKNCMHHALYVA